MWSLRKPCSWGANGNAKGGTEHCFPLTSFGTLAVFHPFLTQVSEHVDITVSLGFSPVYKEHFTNHLIIIRKKSLGKQPV